jgi:hypothetical protein
MTSNRASFDGKMIRICKADKKDKTQIKTPESREKTRSGREIAQNWKDVLYRVLYI